MSSSHDLFVQLANGEYIGGLFHDITPATFTQIHQLLRESVEELAREVVLQSIRETPNQKAAISKIKQQLAEAGKMALLDDPEVAYRIVATSFNVCNTTDSADVVYRKLCDGFREKSDDKLTTQRAARIAQSLRIARFSFLCAAVVWDLKRKNSSQGGHKFVK